MQPWSQNYNPLGNALLSTLIASAPVIILLGSIAVLKMRIHIAALIGLAAAFAIAIGIYRMPLDAATAAALNGAAFGLFPIGWLLLNVIFLYQLTVKRGHFEILRDSLAGIAPDPRIQVILIAFAFGAFLEGMSGFGAPVAITAAILIQLGFRPLHASGLALIANTAPVAFGSLGIPVITLAQVTGLDLHLISATVGGQLTFFSFLIPFWVVAAFAGWRGMLGIWPAALTAGVSFAIPQFLVSNFVKPALVGVALVDLVSGACSIAAIILLLRFWKPKTVWRFDGDGKVREEHPHEAGSAPAHGATQRHRARTIFQAWMPWAILTAFILCWGTFKNDLKRLSPFQMEIPHLHHAVQRMPPIVTQPEPEKAVLNLDIVSATGTGILLAAITAGLTMGFSPMTLLKTYGETIWRVRFSLLTIALMLALGYVTRYSGTDATLGLALAHTGQLYPFFGTLLGWLGVALTGSDTASNVLFGSLQKITAHQLHISPVLMAAANSSGGVMGKMVDAQSIVVASTATNWYGHEGDILRYVLFHSLALATLVAILVYCQAYIAPFTHMVPQ
jgi:lactate permease